MKFILKNLVLLITILILNAFAIAEDEAKKEIKKQEENKPKEELKSLKLSGVIIRNGGTGKTSYYIETAEKKILRVDHFPGEKVKVFDYESFVGKQVVIKFKGSYKPATNEKKDSEYEIIQLLSIELKDTKATSEKKTDENKKDESIKDPGNVPIN